MKVSLSVLVFCLLTLGVQLLAQTTPVATVPSPAQIVATVIATPVSQVGFFDFVKSHIADFALAIYALLDVIILAIPSLAGNGLLHQILIMAGKLSNQNPPAS